MEYLGEDHSTPIHLTERFSRFINHLGQNGGVVRKELGAFADDLKLPVDALRKIKTRAEKLGIIRIQTNGTYVGMGRLPNSYHLRIEWADWPKLRAKLAQEHQDAQDEAVRNMERRRSEKRAEATIRRRRATAVVPPVRAWPPPPPTEAERLLAEATPAPAPAAPDDDLDVDAWTYAPGF